VIAFLVAHGAREVGIRMALGATPRGIGMLVLRHGFIIAAAGLALGIAGAFAVTRLMQSLLFGVAAGDPMTYGLVAAFVAATALAASYIPARRAAKLDPMRTLR
jgi:putative ABC transport system permease protein